jgi:hypothetical protein
MIPKDKRPGPAAIRERGNQSLGGGLRVEDGTLSAHEQAPLRCELCDSPDARAMRCPGGRVHYFCERHLDADSAQDRGGEGAP